MLLPFWMLNQLVSNSKSTCSRDTVYFVAAIRPYLVFFGDTNFLKTPETRKTAPETGNKYLTVFTDKYGEHFHHKH